MEFGKRRNTTDRTDFCPGQLVTDLLQICYDKATGKLVEWILSLKHCVYAQR